MKPMLIFCSVLFAACSFNASGSEYLPEPDAGSDGSDAGPDAGTDAGGSDAAVAPPPATIVCSNEAVDGYPKVVLTFGADIEAAFLGDIPTDAEPVEIAYGSNQEDLAVLNSCFGTWTVPYGPGCNKRTAAWGTSPKLYLEPEVDELNVAIIYDDGTVRWGDLKTDDLDGVGFSVSGLDCRVELTGGGSGGYLRTKP